MESPIRIGILEQTVFVFIVYPHLLVFLFLGAHKVIRVDKVVAGVVRRIYVPTDFDTKEKALSGAKAAEKGLK